MQELIMPERARNVIRYLKRDNVLQRWPTLYFLIKNTLRLHHSWREQAYWRKHQLYYIWFFSFKFRKSNPTNRISGSFDVCPFWINQDNFLNFVFLFHTDCTVYMQCSHWPCSSVSPGLFHLRFSYFFLSCLFSTQTVFHSYRLFSSSLVLKVM